MFYIYTPYREENSVLLTALFTSYLYTDRGEFLICIFFSAVAYTVQRPSFSVAIPVQNVLGHCHTPASL